jgi:alpha-galactosidase
VTLGDAIGETGERKNTMIRHSSWLCLGTMAVAGAGANVWERPNSPGASAEELQVVQRWTDGAFARPRPTPIPAIANDTIAVLRQSHKVLLKRTVWDTPTTLGETAFEHGVYMDAPAAVRVHLGTPAVEFTAQVGIDANDDTRRNPGAGSARFHVVVGGQRVFSSPVRRLADGPLPIAVPLDGATRFELEVDDGDDGRGWDQCSWADARIAFADGTVRFLDQLALAPLPWNPSATPFSFAYGGVHSAEFLPSWEYLASETPAPGGKSRRLLYRDPGTGLVISAEVTVYADAAAVEWVLHLENQGAADTPVIERLMPLDCAALPGAETDAPLTLRWSHGDRCAVDSYLPHDEALPRDTLRSFAGHSSDTACLPFFNLKERDSGWLLAIGWTGRWQAEFEPCSGGGVALRAGLPQTHFRLRPGERVRSPRILLLHYRDRSLSRGHNQFRRLLLRHLVPQDQGAPIRPPVAHNSVAALWLQSTRSKQPLGRLTAASELALIDKAAAVGCEAYWMDAYWFPQPWWEKNMGNWYPRADDFPHGLRPLGDAAHARGMQFVLWFAPLHVHPTTRWATEYPQFVHGGSAGGAWKLADPEAREFLVDWLTRRRAEWGFDVYREDFGTPLPPDEGGDRLGLAEMLQIDGFYQFWGELLRRNPGLVIDNCSGGGRRIDLDTIRLAYTLWRSDFNDVGEGLKDRPHWPLMGLADQVMVSGLSLYFPLHAGPVWDARPYCFRSAMGPGIVLYNGLDSPDLPADLVRQAIAELKELRPFFLGDIHPLLPITLSQADWYACQFDRPDLGAGCVLVFRRPESLEPQHEIALQGIDPGARYQVSVTGETYTQATAAELRGHALATMTLQVPEQPGSALIRYRRL